MIAWRDILVESERRYDEITRAREARLVRQFALMQPRSPERRRRWLHLVGGKLVSWGLQLQARPPVGHMEAGNGGRAAHSRAA